MNITEWREKGKCWGKTTSPSSDYWYAEDDDDDKQRKNKIAKSYCEACPVKKECLQFALDNKEEYGIWGGMTTRERKAYERQGTD